MKKSPIKSLCHSVTSPFKKGVVYIPYILVIILFFVVIFYFSKASSLEEKNKNKYKIERANLIEQIEQKRNERKDLQEKYKQVEEDFARLTSKYKQSDEYLSGSINRDKEKLKAIDTLIGSGTAHSEPVIADPPNISLIPKTYAGNNSNAHTLNSHIHTGTENTENKLNKSKTQKKVGTSHGRFSKGNSINDGNSKTKLGIKKTKQKTQSQTSTTSIQSAKNRKKDKHFWNVYNLAIPVIQKYEGLRLRAYRDGAGCSIGWGTVARHCGEVINEAEANKRLAYITRKVVLRIRTNHPNLTAKQQAALVSFAYNCERGYKDVLARGLHAHKYWCKSFEGKRLPGLVARRNEEARMLFQ